MVGLQAGEIVSPSRAAMAGLKANAERELWFVLRRRQEEREAAANRVRCNFKYRGKWTRSSFGSEVDIDAVRIVARSMRLFLIRQRARRRLRDRRRLLAARKLSPTLEEYVERRRTERAARAALTDLKMRIATRTIERFARSTLELRIAKQQRSSAVISRFFARRLAFRRLREASRKRDMSSSTISRICRRCLRRRRAERAAMLIQQTVRGWQGRQRTSEIRRASAADSIMALVRGEAARRRFRTRLETRQFLLRNREEAAALAVVVRSMFVALARRRRKVLAAEREELAQKRTVAWAVLVVLYCRRLADGVTMTRYVRQLAAERTKAATRLTVFARGVVAKVRCREIVRRRAEAAAARTIQRVLRGGLGRIRARKIRADTYRCRRCQALVYSGRYCKKCGFARYAQVPVKLDFGNSPYAPGRVRPSFVKKLRSRIAAAKKKPGETSFMPMVTRFVKDRRRGVGTSDVSLVPQVVQGTLS